MKKIDKGTILLNKNIINDLLPSKRDMAMVFQSYALYPHMNVYENMSFGLKMEKISKNNIQKKGNVIWTASGRAELTKVPFFVRGKVKSNTEKYALSKGLPEINDETLYDAKAFFG